MMSKDDNLSETIQDYLKAIYELAPNGGRTSTNQIAERLNVAPASVTGMLKRLVSMPMPLVDYHKHHGAQLTAEGLRISLEIIRKHRLIELFLVKILGYSWDEVHPEAERLEHAVSFHFVDRLAGLLEEPDYDPHGDPIPNRDLELPEQNTVLLSEAKPDQPLTIRRVQSSDPALLRYLGDMGVLPGVRIMVTARVPFDHTVRVRIGESETDQVLGSEICQLLHVEAS